MKSDQTRGEIHKKNIRGIEIHSLSMIIYDPQIQKIQKKYKNESTNKHIHSCLFFNTFWLFTSSIGTLASGARVSGTKPAATAAADVGRVATELSDLNKTGMYSMDFSGSCKGWDR